MEVETDYGINIAFTCGLALQQEFDWLVNLPKDKILTQSNNMELCFEEENFDVFLKKLQAYTDMEQLGEVVTHSWGQRVVRFYDLDKHLIEVGECMKAVVNRFLSDGLSMAETAKKMEVSLSDIEKILYS